MPYCTKCGKYSESQTPYCTECGGLLQPSTPVAQPTQPTWAGLPTLTPVYYQHDEQQEFLDQFSWGPGCGIYFWSRAMLGFLLGSVLLNFMSRLLLSVPESSLTGNSVLAGGVALASLIVFAAAIGLLIWAGKVGRRRRWQMLRWRDFEQFQRDEKSWQPYGIIGWIITGLIFVVSFIIGLVGGVTS